MAGAGGETVAVEGLAELGRAGDEVEGFDLAQAHAGEPGEGVVEALVEVLLDAVELHGERWCGHGVAVRSDAVLGVAG